MTNPEILHNSNSTEGIDALKRELLDYVATMPEELRRECAAGIEHSDTESLKKLAAVIEWAEGYVAVTRESNVVDHAQLRNKLKSWIKELSVNESTA